MLKASDIAGSVAGAGQRAALREVVVWGEVRSGRLLGSRSEVRLMRPKDIAEWIRQLAFLRRVHTSKGCRMISGVVQGSCCEVEKGRGSCAEKARWRIRG